MMTWGPLAVIMCSKRLGNSWSAMTRVGRSAKELMTMNLGLIEMVSMSRKSPAIPSFCCLSSLTYIHQYIRDIVLVDQAIIISIENLESLSDFSHLIGWQLRRDISMYGVCTTPSP